MHKLKQLVDNSLEELPVGSQEPRILSHNVHDVRRYYSLVVFTPFLLTQAEQVLQINSVYFVCLMFTTFKNKQKKKPGSHNYDKL